MSTTSPDENAAVAQQGAHSGRTLPSPSYSPVLAPSQLPAPPVGYGQTAGHAQSAYGHQAAYVGNIRSTGTCMLLAIVTLGIYSWYWTFKVHQEIKDHSGRGMGGGLAVLLWIVPFLAWLMPFLTSSAVGDLYRARRWNPPVSGATGAWMLLPLIGGIIWFVKTNGALNTYWRHASNA